jgi:hypothetical protein
MNNSTLDRRTFHKVALTGLGGCLGMPGRCWSEEPVTEGPAIEPLPFVEGSFTIAVLPDTQKYSWKYHDHYYRQTEWIVSNKDKFNIQFVTHLGDITDNNTPEEWEVAQRAMSTLSGKVPYSLITGNHDHGPGGSSENRDTLLNEFFPWSSERRQPTLIGAMDEGRMENTYHVFNVGKHKFLVLALEWGPRDQVVEWANTIAAKYPDHHAILTTHAYMYFDDTRHNWDKYKKLHRWNPRDERFGISKLPGGTNDGQQLWDKLVSRHKNFFLTLNGHILEDGLGRLTSSNQDGGDVHQIAVNYQMRTEGGEGYLRLLEFLPDGETVQAKSYSPSTGKYKTDPQNQFVLRLNPPWGT